MDFTSVIMVISNLGFSLTYQKMGKNTYFFLVHSCYSPSFMVSITLT